MSIVDATCEVRRARRVLGPQAREVFARFTRARPARRSHCPSRALRPGSIARTPGLLVREDEDRFLVLFGWALGQYLWTIVADAGAHLGGVADRRSTRSSRSRSASSPVQEEAGRA